MFESPQRVLLVEDNELDARSITRSLKQQLSEVVIDRVANLSGARDACDHGNYDAILLDLSLPDSDGLQSLTTMLSAAPATPVIVLTGLNDPDAALAAVEQGAQDWLDKGSITPELIARALRYAIARHHSESELRRARVLVESLNTREEIARDLHDTVIQRLFALGMQLQGATRLPSSDLVARVDRSVDEIDDIIRELRNTIFGIHESASFDRQLDELVQRYATSHWSCEVDTPTDLTLDDERSHDLLAMIEEALSNIAQHAHAHEVTITVAIQNDDLVATITDDGVGVNAASDDDPERGNGLANMRSRALRHGGSVQLREAESGGTLVEIQFPNLT